jgi:carbon monoxide dehydrogenase subunit G
MNIEGTYTLQASAATLWHCLLDLQVLEATIPGLQHIEHIDDSHYDLQLHLDQKPLNGTHHISVAFSDQQFPSHYTMTVRGVDTLSSLSGTTDIYLRGNDHSTVISYHGAFTLPSSQTSEDSILMRGAIKLFIQQYFQSLTEYLHNTYHPQSTTQHADDIIIIYQQNIHQDGPDALPSLTPLTPSSTLLGRCIRLFHLANDDPQEQQLLEQRLRRLGILSALLFLVWVGTRIPQRR